MSPRPSTWDRFVHAASVAYERPAERDVVTSRSPPCLMTGLGIPINGLISSRGIWSTSPFTSKLRNIPQPRKRRWLTASTSREHRGRRRVEQGTAVHGPSAIGPLETEVASYRYKVRDDAPAPSAFPTLARRAERTRPRARRICAIG